MEFEFKSKGKKNLPGSLESATSDNGVERPGSSDIRTTNMCILNNLRVEELEMWAFSFFSFPF